MVSCKQEPRLFLFQTNGLVLAWERVFPSSSLQGNATSKGRATPGVLGHCCPKGASNVVLLSLVFKSLPSNIFPQRSWPPQQVTKHLNSELSHSDCQPLPHDTSCAGWEQRFQQFLWIPHSKTKDGLKCSWYGMSSLWLAAEGDGAGGCEEARLAPPAPHTLTHRGGELLLGCAPHQISSHKQAKMSKMPKEVFIIFCHKSTVLKNQAPF